ncbi:hypothetical protein MTR_5g053355 [Medicago truncatula]|uniref:Uncharacterized protein n=1 Tax=Medicago truncatula TaxID=3880 RepID=A0A072UQ39_MEDTR|nr:hypothetical protein MTR_5g053355 [Medicago truncatula]
MFISIIKSCINKPVEHLNPVLSLDFEFLVYEAEEEDDEETSTKISLLLGHLGHRSSKYQERLSKRGLSCTKTGTRCYHLSCKDIILQVHTSTWATHPPSLCIKHKRSASHGGQSPVNGSSNES